MNPLYQFTVPTLIKMLRALDGVLGKTQEQVITKQLNETELLETRLTEDMFPLKKQVQVACDTAKGAASRLAGLEIPSHADEEQTIQELRARIAKTLEFLGTFSEDSFKDAAERQITLPYFPGLYLTGWDYGREFVIPNFLFHVTTAYAILRMKGIEIGKADYIGGLPLKPLTTS